MLTVSSAQLSSAQLSSAQLSSAQLSSAQLSSAQLSSAQLRLGPARCERVATTAPAVREPHEVVAKRAHGNHFVLLAGRRGRGSRILPSSRFPLTLAASSTPSRERSRICRLIPAPPSATRARSDAKTPSDLEESSR
ncbi:pentapeptide repeat-containing protein [Brachybacterium sp. ACRRE]|uniref:pentapeptide repeat-containing protein n=1 Tax=Brachybacterium sp. ACRRE TaxID=2918184 RepID=UPI00351DA7B1